MLDYLLSPHQARREPADMFFVAAVLVSFAVLVELFLPSLRGSILIFAMVPAIPMLRTLLIEEELGDEKERPNSLFDAFAAEGTILARHGRLITILSWFFLGATFAYAAWYAFLPPEVSASLYVDQVREVEAIQNVASGMFTQTESAAFLFTHNMQVLFLMFAFSLIHGIGSIYLLLWNASIIGVVIGEQVRGAGVLSGLTGFLGILPHGALELGAYFVASLSGGILSAGIMRGHWKRPGFKQVLIDSATLALIAVLLTLAAATIEGAY
jgi:uncharacterized membrane protein SpoIIM required for sporulation